MKTCKCCNCYNKECTNAQCKEECSSSKEAKRKEFCSGGYIEMCSDFRKRKEN